MDLETLHAFLKWCTLINAGLLIFMTLVTTFAQSFIYRFHSRLFPMQRETMTVILYCFLGFYKLLWIVLNLVPFLALELLRR